MNTQNPRTRPANIPNFSPIIITIHEISLVNEFPGSRLSLHQHKLSWLFFNRPSSTLWYMSIMLENTMKTLKPIPQTKRGTLAMTHLGLCPIATRKGEPWSQWRLKSPWAAILKSTKQRRWWPRLRLSLLWSADLLIDAFIGLISITNEHAWRERPHFFCIGPQSSRHVLFIIDDSYAGIYHHWSRKDECLFILYC